ncbi:MAG TPA: hypothetical protein VIT42_15815 [Microlunatus sp.]
MRKGRPAPDEFLAGFTVQTPLADDQAAATAVADARTAIAETDWADPAEAFSTQSFLTRLQSSLPTSHQLGMCHITGLDQPVLAVAGSDGTWTICVPGVGATVSVDLTVAAGAAWELLEPATSGPGRCRRPTDPAALPEVPVAVGSPPAPSDDERDPMPVEHQSVAASGAETDQASPVSASPVDGIGVDDQSPEAHRIAEALAYLDREAPRWPRTSAAGEICQAVGTRLLGRKHHWHPGDR